MEPGCPLRLWVSTAGLSLMNDQLFLLGGWNEAEKLYKAAVQTYDPATDSWSRAEDHLEPMVGVCCCSLTLHPRQALRQAKKNHSSHGRTGAERAARPPH